MGKYTLGRHLGRGAYGDVYAGRPQGGLEVAVKVLDGQAARDPDVIARFEREAETAQRLEHAHIVKILDVGSSRGKHYLVMELLRGGSFRQLLRKGAPPGRVLAVLAQSARALAFAHEKGVVHRDVKPENVLLTRAGRAKVADFGLARAGDQSTLTTEGRMLGTALYMSPEQARGERATPASDVYSIGVMIYESIAGERPFSSDTAFGFIYQHVQHTPPPPRVLPEFPPGLGALAMRCLAKDPAVRPSMAEVAARLEEALAWRPPRRLRAFLIVAALVIAAVAALLLLPEVRAWILRLFAG